MKRRGSSLLPVAHLIRNIGMKIVSKMRQSIPFSHDFQTTLPPLPKSLPEDMEVLPAIPPETPGLVNYLQKARRWSFAKHLREFPMHGTGAQYQANYLACLAGLAEGHPSNVVQYLVQQEAVKKGRPHYDAYKQTRDSVLNGHRYLSGAVRHKEGRGVQFPKLGIDLPRVREIALNGDTLLTLKESSRGIPESPQRVLGPLYRPETLLWCGRDKFANSTPRTVGDWLARDLSGYQYIVPNPMTALTGLTKGGRESYRCLGNTGPRKFLVIEFDFKPGASTEVDTLLTDLQKQGRTVGDLNAALHCHLQEFLPLAMVVFSGGSSLHGWYPCEHIAPEKQEIFFDYAVTLKADPQLRNHSQPVRFPWGKRASNGAVQEVLYFNPEVLQA